MEKIVKIATAGEAGAMEIFPGMHPLLALIASEVRVTLSVHF